MSYWKLGCNWGQKKPDFFDILKQYSIVICGVKEMVVGDIVAITQGHNVVALALINDPPCPSTHYLELENIFNEKQIDYEVWNKVAKATVFELDPSERFQYQLQQGICEIHKQEIIYKLKNLFDKYLSEMNKNKDIESYKKLLTTNHNLILTGAPGTGKTYLAKQIARKMIVDAVNKKMTDDEEEKLFNEHCGFVQFHPSYDYTDFVEGLRPVQDDTGNVGFERKDGVFKKFCEKAMLSNSMDKETLMDLNDNPTVWKVSLEGTGENPTRKDCLENGYIRIGWSGYGDVADFSNFNGYTDQGGSTILVAFQSKMKIGDIVVSCFSATETDAIGIITGEYEYRAEGGHYPRYRTVKWLVKDIRENIVEKNRGKAMTLSTVYKLSITIQDVLEIVKKHTKGKTESNKKDPFVFIIDEINRGEISKIFGELFFSIDPGYRGEEGKVNTQYQNLVKENNIFYNGFFVPENVYIIGTMNDIDRSVESMDFAFRRRFAFKEIKAEETQNMLDKEESWKDEKGNIVPPPEDSTITEIKNRMTNLNNAIWDDNTKSGIEGLSSAYHIGASYFLKLVNYRDEDKKYVEKSFADLWDKHLEGLLREYLRGMQDVEEKLKNLKEAYDTQDDAAENQ